MKNALVPLVLLLAGCLEHEEAIEVRPDGSLAVELTTKGQRTDLCTGYAVPLAHPWTPRNAGAREWLESFAPDTGGPRARARLEELAGSEPGDATLVVGLEVPSADELPGVYAPADEPYRGAYLARDADLSIERRGRRTVYTFERVYRGRRWASWDVLARARRELSPAQAEAVEHGLDLDRAEWPEVRAVLEDAYVDASLAFARGALASAWTEGDASLPPEALGRALDEAARELRAIVGREALDRVFDLVREIERAKRAGDDENALGDELAELVRSFEARGRDALRAAVEGALEGAGADARLVHAVRARLEWSFTSYDHTGDLSDERFTVRVRMPGVVVDGNFDVLDGEVASWTFDGTDLRDADKRMRVVSVL